MQQSLPTKRYILNHQGKFTSSLSNVLYFMYRCVLWIGEWFGLCANAMLQCIYIYIYIYMCVCVCVCVSKWVGPWGHCYFFRIYYFILFLYTCMFPAFYFRQRAYMAQGLVNRILKRTLTHSCLQFEYLDANKTAGEKARRQLHKNAASNSEQVLEATPHKARTIRPSTSHHENYPSQTNQTCRTLLEKQGRAHKWCTPMPTSTYGRAKRDDQLERTYSSYVRIQDVALKTCQRRWTIGRSDERGSGISVLAA